MAHYTVGREPRARRCPRNEAESAFFNMMKEKGMVAIKRGWPDFHAVTPSGRFICVEVKPYEVSWVKHDQDHVMRHLASHGVHCYVWTPKGGFVQVSKDGVGRWMKQSEVFV